MKFSIVCLMGALLLPAGAGRAWAQEAEPSPVVVTLLAPAKPVDAGSEVEVTLVALNPTANEVNFTVTAPIQGRIVSDGGSWPVELNLQKAALPTITANGFVSRNYIVTLPGRATGRVVLELTYPQPARAVIDITRNAAVVAQAAVMPAEAKAPLANAKPAPAMASIARTFPGRFTPNQPIYFAAGTKAPAVKFQFSLKYRLLGDDGAETTGYPVQQALHFGYTQRSLWDIQASSSPFYDTSYMPELMYEVLAPAKTTEDGGFHWLGVQASAQHESNGRDGTSSRTINIFYVRPMMAFGRLDGWRVIFAPKLFTYLGGVSENPDIAKYRGYSELYLSIGKNDSLAVAFTGRVGKDFDRGSLEVNATYPLRSSWGKFATYGFVQYFTGYGESILYYNQSTSALRAGFSFIR